MSGIENAADIPARFCSGNDLGRMFDGPEFLRGLEFSVEECDVHGRLGLVEKVVNSENKSSYNVKDANPMLEGVETFSAFFTNESNNEIKLDCVVDITRCSFSVKLMIVTSYVLRFIKN